MNDTVWTFVSLAEGDDKQSFTSFKDAFICMFNWVTDNLEKGMSYQVLETCIWIETPAGTPLGFYDARDLAYEAGVMKNGKLVK